MRKLLVLLVSVCVIGCGDSVSKDQKSSNNNTSGNNTNNGGDSCGDGTLDPGEICDGGITDGEDGACPTSCAAPACSTAILNGSAAQCNAVCDVQPIACTNGDGCCPLGCDSESDDDCSNLCGDGAVEAPEICDGDCPTSCDDSNACSSGVLSGDPNTCSSTCTTTTTTTCTDGDGCCPDGCDGQDDDCVVAPMCGDGTVNPGELCDGDCPTACDDSLACTNDTLVGTQDACDARCLFEDITSCVSDDGCCPTGCEFDLDNDCACTPSSCQQQGIECGGANDGCGMSLSCGTCPNGETCNAGTCVGAPNGDIGSTCSNDAQCDSGNCDLTVPNGYCTGGSCAALLTPCPGGETCKIDLLVMDLNGFCVEACTSDNDCRVGLVCQVVDPLSTDLMGCTFPI